MVCRYLFVDGLPALAEGLKGVPMLLLSLVPLVLEIILSGFRLDGKMWAISGSFSFGSKSLLCSFVSVNVFFSLYNKF